VTGEHIADAGDAAVLATDNGESLPREVFQALKIAGHVAIDVRDPDA
jgi:hypothetical protein